MQGWPFCLTKKRVFAPLRSAMTQTEKKFTDAIALFNTAKKQGENPALACLSEGLMHMASGLQDLTLELEKIKMKVENMERAGRR
ncbi:MAG: hypothetical protein QOF48_3320 [Verrucomicrobiota bacterium]